MRVDNCGGIHGFDFNDEDYRNEMDLKDPVVNLFATVRVENVVAVELIRKNYNDYTTGPKGFLPL